MPQPSKVAALPPAVREWLEQTLIEQNFGNYDLLEALLAERGYVISRSAIHRFGQDFRGRVEAIKLATQQAKAIIEASPDDANAMNGALHRLVQERLFGVLVDLNLTDDDAVAMLPKLGKTIAELGKSSVAQKGYETKVRERAAEAAAQVEAMSRQHAGLSADLVDAIKRQILGITG